MTIDVGNGRDTDASVLQQETIINRAANTTELTIEKDQANKELVFNKPSNKETIGRMSLKGALPKQGEERANLRDEPFANSPEETKGQDQSPAGN